MSRLIPTAEMTLGHFFPREFAQDANDLAQGATGEVIETASRRVLTILGDEKTGTVQSEKVVEVVFRDGKPSANGDQFGIGRRP